MSQQKRRGLSAAKIIGGGLAAATRLFTLPFGSYYGSRIAAHASAKLAPVVRIETGRGIILYPCPTATTAKAAHRMLTREPETIEWIEEHVKPGDHVWDVGANIGTYSIYSCLGEDVTATAFEPVASNFAVLVDAVLRNGLGAQVTPLPMGLSDETGLLTIFLIDLDAGAGLHALGKPANVRGDFEPQGSVMVPVIRGEDVISRFGAMAPTQIKIDVDGHELRVLEGLLSLLPGVRSVWIEMTKDAEVSGVNAQIKAIFENAGFEEARLRSGRSGENQLFVNRAIK